MNITGKDPSEWQKIVPVDEGVAEQIRNVVRESFLLRNGMCGYGADADKEANWLTEKLESKTHLGNIRNHLIPI